MVNEIKKRGERVVNRVYSALKKEGEMTITDVVSKTKLSRSAVRTALAKLEGAEKVFVKEIGMAKLYTLK